VALLVRALFVLVATLVSISPILSGDPEAERRTADARQKLFVRRALSEDSTLGPHAGDIWIDVRGTTTILSGHIPSTQLKQRAVFLAGQVKGIGEVRADDLLVSRNGIGDLPSPFTEGVPPQATLAGIKKDGHTTQAPDRQDIPVPQPSPEQPPPSSKRPIVEMLPPQPLPDPPSLASAVETARRKEERFRRLKVEVRQKTLVVSGTVARWEDATALAQALRLLPDVALVLLDNVRVDPTGLR